MSDHRYRISYDLNNFERLQEPKTAAELAASGRSGTDGFALFTFKETGDGGLTIDMAGGDGRTGEPLDAADLYMIWVALTENLASGKAADDLSENGLAIMRMAQVMIRAHFPHGLFVTR